MIFVGEIRDGDSAMSAIQAAETGHLVISTLHTIDCMETINRILDLFPPQQQREVRSSFAGSLRGIVSQRLVSKADGKGRVPAIEVLVEYRASVRSHRGPRHDRPDHRRDRRG